MQMDKSSPFGVLDPRPTDEETIPAMKNSGTTTFDGWVLRADIGELSKDGRRIRLQQRPGQVPKR